MVTGRVRSENQTRAEEGEEIHVSPFFFPIWISFLREFTVPIAQAALLVQCMVQKQTAVAPKLAKWPKYDDGTASLGYGSIRLILKENSTSFENF